LGFRYYAISQGIGDSWEYFQIPMLFTVLLILAPWLLVAIIRWLATGKG
jgi:hypothetical protein